MPCRPTPAQHRRTRWPTSSAPADAISSFRANITTGAVQLLYGEAQLPAYVNGAWQSVNNNMGGVAGLYGSSGFGNPFNNYTWSMAVNAGMLYVGTMDWSYLASQAWPAVVQQLGLPADTPNPITAVADYGADLWRFPSAKAAAKPVYTDGVGNYLNYGVRNMLSVEDLGRAEPRRDNRLCQSATMGARRVP